MNIRVKFRKYGTLKFIGHLDVMRYFQKAIRRAGLDICYSEGFSPHMIMSFASPLGVGLTSDGEYMDIRVNTSPSSREALARLNETMAEGMEVLSWKQLPADSKNAMSVVAAADYELRFRPGCRPEEGWQEKFRKFLSLDQILVDKKTKKGQKTLDIRPWIYQWEADGDGIFMQVSAGSVHNLKPELLMQAFGLWSGLEIPPSSLLVHRKEIYADQGTDSRHRFVPLEAAGEDIE